MHEAIGGHAHPTHPHPPCTPPPPSLLCSFREATHYQLGGRGLVVVSGRVEGPTAAGVESNGAGKTALVMAPLWALTGEVDARSEVGAWVGGCLGGWVGGWGAWASTVRAATHARTPPPPLPSTPPTTTTHPHTHPPLPCAQGGGGRGLTHADVVHDACKVARVRVEGAVNGEPFAVERQVARRCARV